MSKITGGQAFPIIGTHEEVIEVGMALRDYFAAKAMHAFIRGAHNVDFGDGGDPKANCEKYSRVAYAMADAMLAAREKEARA